MAVAWMGKLWEIADNTPYGLFGWINLPMAVELTIEVWRPGDVDGSTVNMPYFSMTMIRFGVNVEQGSCKRP